ncbi:tetratricopeptide repeat protein [bacterium]|nr:tetratricopeptide repeat protein [bacterium]
MKIKLAECYLENGDIVKAKAIYQEVLKSNPKSELTPIAKKMLQQL